MPLTRVKSSLIELRTRLESCISAPSATLSSEMRSHQRYRDVAQRNRGFCALGQCAPSSNVHLQFAAVALTVRTDAASSGGTICVGLVAK